MNKLFSVATQALFLWEQSHFLKKILICLIKLDVGLCPSNLPDPSAERISIPIKDLGTYLRKYWQTFSILNLEGNLMRNILIWRHCEKLLICLSGSAVSVPIWLASAADTGKDFFLGVYADVFWTNNVLLHDYLNSEFFVQFQTAAKAITRGRRVILHLLQGLIQLPYIIQI